MKIGISIFIVVVCIVIILFIFQGINSRKGVAAGLINGLLSPCSKKPNCICSENNQDVSHYIDPIILSSGDEMESFLKIKNTIKNTGGIFQSEIGGYAAYQFSLSVFGFVDDLEIRFDKENKIIHFRSASRVGTSDFGVNKKRVELIKSLYKLE